uniref:Uncharacterized protein n=3 Tax=Nothobranchius TaxID=28779 RepID=A0A1A8NC11_9TELE
MSHFSQRVNSHTKKSDLLKKSKLSIKACSVNVALDITPGLTFCTTYYCLILPKRGRSQMKRHKVMSRFLWSCAGSHLVNATLNLHDTALERSTAVTCKCEKR